MRVPNQDHRFIIWEPTAATPGNTRKRTHDALAYAQSVNNKGPWGWVSLDMDKLQTRLHFHPIKRHSKHYGGLLIMMQYIWVVSVQQCPSCWQKNTPFHTSWGGQEFFEAVQQTVHALLIPTCFVGWTSGVSNCLKMLPRQPDSHRLYLSDLIRVNIRAIVHLFTWERLYMFKLKLFEGFSESHNWDYDWHAIFSLG